MQKAITGVHKQVHSSIFLCPRLHFLWYWNLNSWWYINRAEERPRNWMLKHNLIRFLSPRIEFVYPKNYRGHAPSSDRSLVVSILWWRAKQTPIHPSLLLLRLQMHLFAFLFFQELKGVKQNKALDEFDSIWFDFGREEMYHHQYCDKIEPR